MGVSQVVESDDRDGRAAHDALEGLADGVGVHGCAGRGGEHPARIVNADCAVVGGLERSPAGEHGQATGTKERVDQPHDARKVNIALLR